MGGNPPAPRDRVPSSVPAGGGNITLSAPLDLLLGPLTSIGATDYDTLHAAQSAAFETVDPALDVTYNYYDRCLAMYMMYYRTGVEHWRTTARAIGYYFAREAVWVPNGANGMPNSGGPGPAPAREYGSQGLACYYLDTGDTLARDVVGYQWLWAEWYVTEFDRENSDAREAAYALMTCCTAHLLGFTATSSIGYTPATRAAVLAQSFLTLQSGDLTGGAQPNEAWQCYEASGAQVPAHYWVTNFMQGLATEALVLYDRTFPGNADVLAAIKRCADWQWATQWVALGGGPARAYERSTSSVTLGTGAKTFTVSSGLGWTPGAPIIVYSTTGFPENPGLPYEYMLGTITSYSGTTLVIDAVEVQGTATRAEWDIRPVNYPLDQTATGPGCFQYANINSGTVSRSSANDYICLTGLILPAFGYLYAKGQGASYKTYGDAQLASLSSGVYFLTKQYSEGFRSSPRYLGWTA